MTLPIWGQERPVALLRRSRNRAHLAVRGRAGNSRVFARPYWGRGLATEGASAWVRAAFVNFELDRLTAFAHPENLASLRVLEKLHLRSMGHDRVLGMESLVFSLSAAEFQLLARD